MRNQSHVVTFALQTYKVIAQNMRKLSSLLIVIVILVGCSKNQEETTILEYENPSASLEGHNLKIKNKITLYHQKGIVTKSITEQEVIGDEGSEVFLEQMAIKTKEEHNKQMLENLQYEYEIKDNTLKETTETQYQPMDLEALAEDEANTDNIKDVVNEDFQVVYDKLVKVYTDMGYKVVK